MADLPEPLLAGRLIYLSAAMPESEEDAANAEEAIVSLSRAVYSEHGRMLVNEEEELVALVALVAGEYMPVEPEEERQEEPPGAPRQGETPVSRPEPPLIVLPRQARFPESEERYLLQRFGYLRPFDPEERMRLLARADAMVCIGRQQQADWHDFQRASERRRPVVALPSTGAPAPDPEAAEFERELRPTEERFLGWMEQRRRLEQPEHREPMEAPWSAFEEPALPATSYPLLTQLLVERLRNLMS